MSGKSKEKIDEVVKNLSHYGKVTRISRYGPFIDLTLPDKDTANNFVRDYDRNRELFEGIKSIDVPACYTMALHLQTTLTSSVLS